MNNIMTGIWSVEIKPPVGMDMTGYLARNSCSTGIHDELMIKALVIDDRKCRLALIVCDLLGLSSEFCREAVKLTAQETSIPEENIVIACTHTHSGPASILLHKCGEIQPEWLEGLKYKIAGCVKKAAESLVSTQISFKTGKCRIGINRVVKNAEDAVKMVDDQIGVLELRDNDKDCVKALLINYACHPVVLGHDNTSYTRDYPYYLEQALKRQMPAEAEVIFTNGCCGDINPKSRGSFEFASVLGEELAAGITNQIECAISQEDFEDAFISIKTLNIDIPLKHDLNRESIKKLIDEFQGDLDRELAAGGNPLMAKAYSAYLEWAKDLYRQFLNGTMPTFVSAEIKVIKIGNLNIVTIPFETFHGVGLKIKAQLGFNNTMVICYANGDFGYLPSKDLYSDASYEAKTAYRFYGYPGPVSENAEEIVLNALTE